MNNTILLAALAVGVFFVITLNTSSKNISSLRPTGVDRVLGRTRVLESEPQGAWLLSYPSSGAAHLLNLIQDITQKTTGTNYGDVVKDETGSLVRDTYASSPIWTAHPNGPFKMSHAELPSGYIPVSSHCGGACIECHPQYYLLPKYVFSKHCATGVKFSPFNMGEKESITYDPHMMKKAVQLVRPPLNNVVSRFLKLYKEKQAMEDEVWLNEFPSTKIGFHRWCDEQARTFGTEENIIWDFNVWNAAYGVPCRAEFYKYIQWHNFVYETKMIMDIPMKVVHTVDLQTNFTAKMQEIFTYLQLTPVKNITEYDGSDMNLEGYSSFYSLGARKKIACFMRSIASAATLKRLEPYFTDCDIEL